MLLLVDALVALASFGQRSDLETDGRPITKDSAFSSSRSFDSHWEQEMAEWRGVVAGTLGDATRSSAWPTVDARPIKELEACIGELFSRGVEKERPFPITVRAATSVEEIATGSSILDLNVHKVADAI